MNQDSPTTHKLMQLFRIKQAIKKWIDKQGHDKCWYYPEIFKEISDILEIKTDKNIEIPEEEFELGCKNYQDELYGTT